MDNTFTPLQLSCYIATLVNGGTRYGAHILQDVRSHATGAIIYKVQTEALNKMMLSDEAVSVVLNALAREPKHYEYNKAPCRFIEERG